MPTMRRADPSGGVHEPLIVQLPALPAPPPPSPLVSASGRHRAESQVRAVITEPQRRPRLDEVATAALGSSSEAAESVGCLISTSH